MEQRQILGGVCGTLAILSGIHANLIRLAFALLALASGIGIAAYLALWWFFTKSQDGEHISPIQRLRIVRSDSKASIDRFKHWLQLMWSDRDAHSWPRPLGRFWFGTMLVLAGVTLFLYSIGLFEWLGLGELVGLFSVLAGVAILTTNREQPAE
jgi:phage shock protein PspC (stress-responsive transcriptional regulator)